MAKKELTLVIGDKNLSSWSMRPWLVMKASGLHFKEVKVLLDRPETAKKLKRLSPSGRVPVLMDGATTIWDSLAICEYIQELAPNKNLWPEEAKARALARSYVAEMHSSFTGLRGQLSMDITLRTKIKHMSAQTVQDIERILELWEAALKKSKGPFLFGEFGIVDAFYAPVVGRFVSYGVTIRSPRVKKYMSNVLGQKAVREWIQGARKESSYEVQF